MLNRPACLRTRAVTALVPISCFVLAGSAAFTTGGSDGPEPLRLVSQDACVDIGADFTLSLQSQGDVRVRVRDRVRSYDQFRATLFRELDTKILSSQRLSPDAGDSISVDLTAGTAPLARAGVYPISISTIDNSGKESLQLVTYACVNHKPELDTTVGVLARAEVAPLATPESTDRYDWNSPPAKSIIRHLYTSGASGYLIAVGGDTLDRWAASSGSTARTLLDQLRTISEGFPVIARPHVPIDHAALAAAGLEAGIADATNLGREVIRERLGPAANIANLEVLDHPSRTAIDDARRRSVRTMVIPGSAIANGRGAGTLRTTNGVVPAMVTEVDLSALWQIPIPKGETALRAQQLTAALAVLVQTNELPPQTVLIDSGTSNPSAGFLELWDASWPTVAGTRALADSDLDISLDSEPLELRTTEISRFSITDAQYRKAQLDLETLATTVGAEDPLVRETRLAIVTALAASLTEPGVTPDQTRINGRSWLNAGDRHLEEAFAGVKLPRPEFTLPSARATIPVTIRNTGDQDLPVMLRVSSPRLTFPEKRTYEWIGVLKPGSTTRNVSVVARSAGSTTVTIEIRSADGRYLVVQERSRISASLVLSRVALLLAALAVAFLMIWWWSHRRTAKRMLRE